MGRQARSCGAESNGEEMSIQRYMVWSFDQRINNVTPHQQGPLVLFADYMREIAEKDAEIKQLRGALIECGWSVGGALADTVSTEFLLQVPHELTLYKAKMVAKKDADARIATLEEENKALRNALEEALERLAEVRRLWKGRVDSGIFSL